mgnify:CR=1 FL=1
MSKHVTTHHFVNLVSWRYFSGDNQRADRKCYVDSVTMQIMCYLMTGIKHKRESGVEKFNCISENDSGDAYYLLPKFGDSRYIHHTVLPFWSTPAEVNADMLDIRSFDSFSVVVIGISSPKQDVLADELRNLTQCSDIYCLGAAVGHNQGTGIFDKLGLNFLYFLCFNTLRTMNKLKLTFLSASKIFLIKKERLLFKSFCKYYFT